MRNFSDTVIDMANRISNADCIIVYGAKKRAQEIVPVCETFSDTDKIKIAVTDVGGGRIIF